MIELQLLGPPTQGWERPPHADRLVARPKLLGLLAYLCAPRPGTFHRRDTVVGMLWPELLQERANGALRNALYLLKQHLGTAGAIIRRGDAAVGIAEDAVRLDTTAFDGAVERGDHDAAIRLYRGEFLQGLHVAGAEAFGHWLDAERRRYRERTVDSMWALVDRHLEAGDAAGTAVLARKAVDLSPGDESTGRRLIATLDGIGDRAGALKAYEDLARDLREEWNAEPAPETVTLMKEIRSRTETLMDSAVGTSKAHLHRARRLLREVLTQ